MQVPDRFTDGFGIKALFGALFLGFAMIPGSIYLALMIGAGLGPAAKWVTVILFAEVARRSMKSLRQQEIFVIFYMTGIALGGQLHGGAMTQLLWNQYLSVSEELAGMGIEVPSFVAPAADIVKQQSFLLPEWRVPIFFLLGMLLIQRIDAFGLGYVLYRWTSRVERLPFPMAPAEGLGITALVDSTDPTEQWKKRCFAIGAMLGLIFGFVYVGVPTITGAIFNAPVQVIPIPWLDLTSHFSTESVLPAMPLNIVFDLSLVLVGMVLPFWAVVGGFVGLVITFILNPMLYSHGYLTTWMPGMSLVDTMFSNQVDFYLSFGIGLAVAIFLISIGQIFRPLIGKMRTSSQSDEADPSRVPFRKSLASVLRRDPVRGDMSILIALGIYLFSTLTYIGVCVVLMPGDPETGVGQFPWLFFLGFAFIYQPIMSYVNAKLEGLVGQTVQIPLVREAAYILSGYTGSTIWFAPIPIANDYNTAVRQFRVMELTGTRLSSLIKTELVVVPVVIVASLVFSRFIWRLAPIPSAAYPFAQEMWRLHALNFSLQATATVDGSSPFMEAIKPGIIVWGAGAGVMSYAVLAFLGLPTFLVYGIVRGLGQTTPGNVIPELAGALIGRIYLQKRFGHQNYKRYMMVVLAGFTAGMGLIGMAAVAVALIAKSTSTLRY